MKDNDTSVVVGFSPLKPAIFLFTLAVGAILGAGGLSVASDKYGKLFLKESGCVSVCVENTGLFIRELHRKGWLKYDQATRMQDDFASKCNEDCYNKAIEKLKR